MRNNQILKANRKKKALYRSVNKTNKNVSYGDWIGHKDLRDCKFQP